MKLLRKRICPTSALSWTPTEASQFSTKIHSFITPRESLTIQLSVWPPLSLGTRDGFSRMEGKSSFREGALGEECRVLRHQTGTEATCRAKQQSTCKGSLQMLTPRSRVSGHPLGTCVAPFTLTITLFILHPRAATLSDLPRVRLSHHPLLT